jgi:DNA replication protein DnaC
MNENLNWCNPEFGDYENAVLRRWAVAANIPLRFRECRGGAPNITDSIYVHGNCGTGKTTYLCGSLYKRAVHAIEVQRDYNNPCYFTSVPNLLSCLQDSFSKNVSSRPMIDKLISVPYLALDDLGTEKISEWSLSVLFLILDSRYQQMLPTLISSNILLKNLPEKIGDRIPSRITGWMNTVNLGNVDFRMEKKK